ncbi:MAG: VWA domain-containing protein [Clostridiales bacterium]|nr:VWA domain-containing protein [Clostridiales bacterium]
MKDNLTELVFILDRSGSMGGLESDTIGGYNSLLNKQKKVEGECVITTVLFDDRYELLHDRINLNGVAPITDKEYFTRGSTALLDAIGTTIKKIENAQKHTAEQERASKVMFVITTDGYENASKEYTYQKIKQMIEQQKKTHDWEFIFLGANIDAVETAAQFGIDANRSANYHADSQGTQLNYEVVSNAVMNFRTCAKVSEDWKDSIDEDFEKRNK